MPMLPNFCNKDVEWVSIVHERFACKKLLMRPSYSETKKRTVLRGLILLIPEFCPGGQGLTCGPTLSTNQMRPWD